MSPRPKRVVFRKSELHDVLRKVPGVTHVSGLNAPRGNSYTGEPATYHFTPIQTRSYSHLGIIHRQMANSEPLWRGSKQPSDPDDVMIDLLKVLSTTERSELKRERDIFTHAVGFVDEHGNFIGTYRYQGDEKPFNFTEPQLREIAGKWLDLERRIQIRFKLTLIPDSGDSVPTTSEFDGPHFGANQPRIVSDEEQRTIRGQYNGALFTEHVKSIQMRWKRLAPVLARLEAGDGFEQAMESVTDEEVEMLAIYFAPHLTLSNQDRKSGLIFDPSGNPR